MQAAVRDFLDCKLLKLKSMEQLAVRCPTLTAKEVKAYEALTTPYFTMENFRIDFVRGWNRFSFNNEAATFFVEKFLDAVAGGSYRDPHIPARLLTEARISHVLEKHITYLRGVYRDQTAPETAAHIKKIENRRIRKRTAARKNTVCAMKHSGVVRRLIPISDVQGSRPGDQPS